MTDNLKARDASASKNVDVTVVRFDFGIDSKMWPQPGVVSGGIRRRQ